MDIFKIIGYVATGIGLAASIVSGWAGDHVTEQEIKNTVKEEVAKAMANQK